MGKHRTATQDEIFIKFMEKNHDYAIGNQKVNRVAAADAWKDLAAKLNAVGPPSKSAEEWRRVWKDWKTTIRKKIHRNKIKTITAQEDRIAVLTNLYTVIDRVPGGNTCKLPPPSDDMENSCEVKNEAVADSPKRRKRDGNHSRRTSTSNVDPSPSIISFDSTSSLNASPANTNIDALIAEQNASLKEVVKELRGLNWQSSSLVAMGAQLTNIMEETLEEKRKFNEIMKNFLSKMN